MAKKTKPAVDERLLKWEEFAAANTGLYAMIDAEGNLLGDCAYESIRDPKNGFAVFKKDGRYGFLGMDGSVTVDPKYERVGDFGYGVAAVCVDGRWGFINEKGETVVTPQYENVSSPYFREGLAYVVKDGKYGFIDMEGNMVIEPVYEYATSFEGNLAGVKVNGKIGFIDKTGKMVIAPEYDNVDPSPSAKFWRAGYAIVTKANKVGLIDREGKVVLPLIYDKVSFMPYAASERRTVADKIYYDFSATPGGSGIIAEDGVVIEPVYSKIGDFSEGRAAASKDGKWGYLDFDGNIALPFEYDGCSKFSGNYATVKKDNRTFIIDKTGREICDKVEKLRFGCEDPLEGYWAGIKDDKCGLLDDAGNFILPCEFDEIERWGITRLISVMKDGKRGVYDLSGKEIIKIEFDYIGTPRTEGVPVRLSPVRWEKEGVVTTDGRFIIKPGEFKSCSVDEKGGVIVVENKDGKAGLRAFDGSEITPCVFDRINAFSDNGMAQAKIDGKFGLLDNKGQWVIPAEYEGIEDMSEGLVGAKKDGKWGFINDKNEWVIAPAYDRIYRDFENGYAIVLNNDKSILINRAGKELTKPAANLDLYRPVEEMIRFRTGRKYGYLDTDGNIAIKPAFEEAEDFKNGCALVSMKVDKQPMWTFVTKDGMTHETFEKSVYNLGGLIPVEKEGKKGLFRPCGTLAVPFVLRNVSRDVEGVTVIQFA